MPSSAEISRLITQVRAGDANAVAQLMPLVYDELRRLAAVYLRRERGGGLRGAFGGPARAGRRDEPAGRRRSRSGAAGGVAFLWEFEHRGDGGSLGRVAGQCETRMDARPCMAAARNGRTGLIWEVRADTRKEGSRKPQATDGSGRIGRPAHCLRCDAKALRAPERALADDPRVHQVGRRRYLQHGAADRNERF